jgi:hypothetical protein
MSRSSRCAQKRFAPGKGALGSTQHMLTPPFPPPQVCNDASTFEDAATLADHAQRVMQLELDHMYATVDEAAASKKDA